MARGARVFRPQRRKPVWSPIIVRSETQALGATQTIGDASLAAEALEPQTVVRLRGSGVVHMVSDAASSSMLVALGIIIVSADAAAVSSLAIPSPMDDADSPWLYHRLIALGPAIGAEIPGDQTGGLVTERFEIDSKAQRKFGLNEVLIIMWDAVIQAGSPVADCNAAVRNLVLLH